MLSKFEGWIIKGWMEMLSKYGVYHGIFTLRVAFFGWYTPQNLCGGLFAYRVGVYAIFWSLAKDN